MTGVGSSTLSLADPPSGQYVVGFSHHHKLANVLTNHVSQLVLTDFFAVRTISFEVLFVFVVLAMTDDMLHFNVRLIREWTAQ
jgi:hypothetical protein